MVTTVRASLCVILILGGALAGHHLAPRVRSRPVVTWRSGPSYEVESPLTGLSLRSILTFQGGVRGSLNGRPVGIYVHEADESVSTVVELLRSHRRNRFDHPSEIDLGDMFAIWNESPAECSYGLAVKDRGQKGVTVFYVMSEVPLRVPPSEPALRDDDQRLGGLPAFPGQRPWLVFKSEGERINAALYEVDGPPGQVYGFFHDQMRAQGWHDLLPALGPRLGHASSSLVLGKSGGEVCLFTFLPSEGKGQTVYLAYHCNLPEEKK